MTPSPPLIPIKKSDGMLMRYMSIGPRFGRILRKLYDLTVPGITPEWLERQFRKLCWYDINDEDIQFPFSHQTNYINQPYNNSICVSINSQIAHARPTDIPIKDGDVVSVDCGISFTYLSKTPQENRLHLDAAFTKATPGDTWVNAPLNALKNIVKINPKNTSDIADIINKTAIEHKLHQVVSLTGHGIGFNLHESPIIHNAPGPYLPVELFNGICFCAEPIFVKPGIAGNGSSITPTCVGHDGWEVSTVTGEYASHWETTFGVIDGRIVDLIGVTNWEL